MNRFPTLARSLALPLLLTGLTLSAMAPAAHGEEATVAYTVSGPDADGHYTYTLKVTNNTTGKSISMFEQFHGVNQTGTGTAGDPPNWSHIFSYGTNDTSSVIFYGSGSPTGSIPPGQTQTGYTWQVSSSAGEPRPGVTLVWFTDAQGHQTAAVVVPEKDKAQTESRQCESAESHGFSSGSSIPGFGFSVIPDVQLTYADCVIAGGDVVGDPGLAYSLWLDSPVVDMSTHPTPKVRFTHLYQGRTGCVASVWVSPDGGMAWVPVASFGEDCLPGETCRDSGRVILELPQFGGVSEMIVRWSYEHVPLTAGAAQGTALAPQQDPAYWLLDDLLITGDAAADLYPVGVEPNPAAAPAWRLESGSVVRDGRPARVWFSLAAAGQVALDLFDVAGRRVGTALAPSVFPAGEHRVQVLGDLARGVAAGVYLLRIEGPGLSGSRRVIVLR